MLLSAPLLSTIFISLSLSLSLSVRRDSHDEERSWARFQEEGHAPRRSKATPPSREQPAATRYLPLSLSLLSSLSLSLSLSFSPSLSPVSEGIVRQGSRQARRHLIGQQRRQTNTQANGQASSQAANHRDAVRATPATFRPSLSLSLSLLPFASLCLSLRSHLPLSFSRFLLVGIPRRKKGHGPNSKRRERRHAHHGGVRRHSQAGSAKSSPWPVGQTHGQPTKLLLFSLSLSPFLKDLENEMAGKLAGPEKERGDGDKHACRRVAN